MNSKIFALLHALAVSFVVTPAFAQICMSDSNKNEIAEGHLSIGQFKDAADRPEEAYILTLPVSTCLDSADPDMRIKRTQTIHIFSTHPGVGPKIGKFVGRTVKVRGEPFAQHTSHHHAPIVMDISEIDAH